MWGSGAFPWRAEACGAGVGLAVAEILGLIKDPWSKLGWVCAPLVG